MGFKNYKPHSKGWLDFCYKITIQASRILLYQAKYNNAYVVITRKG